MILGITDQPPGEPSPNTAIQDKRSKGDHHWHNSSNLKVSECDHPGPIQIHSSEI